MLDHIGVTVTDYERSKTFYSRALAPIGYGVLAEIPIEVAGHAVGGLGEVSSKKPDFWIAAGKVEGSVHVAFQVQTRAAVDAFHKAGIAAGGRDNGAPGLRPHYHATYYGAFVLDPDGHNVEVVCHRPE